MTPITLVCDDGGHVRGKIATMAVFVRAESGVWTDRRESSRTRPFRSRSDSPALFKCKLCRRELPLWAEDRRVLFAVLDWLDERGRVEVTLADFLDLASKVERSR